MHHDVADLSQPRFRSFLAAAAIALLIAPSTAPLAAAEPATATDAGHASVRAFFARHCNACHGAELQEGKLRLDQLSADFNADDARGRWLQVYDKLQAGEMPPPEEPRPAKDEVARVSAWIAGQARDADAARQRDRGRVMMRRLNRVEYENTLRDLLAINADLKDLLPEDGEAHGFDNVGEALQLSSVLMERYLEAADAALDAALVHRGPLERTSQRFDYKQEDIARNERIALVRDDSVVFFSSTYSPTALKRFRAPVAGRYRFRVSAYAYQSARPVTFRVYAGDVIRNDGKSHLVGYYDVAPQPTVVELEDYLLPTESIQVVPYDTGHSIYQVGAANYKEAGLAVQWVEVEGPLDEAWPPESHRRVFGDLPLEPVKNPSRDPRNSRRGQPEYRVVSRQPLADIEATLRRIVPRAFRRRVEDAELQPYLELARQRLEQGHDHEAALRVALKGVFCSPNFLFLVERGAGDATGFELASRLSYFLWSSLPDDELFRLAAGGTLHEPAVLRAQVERMLADPRAQRFTRNFVGQWLDLREIDFTTPDRQLYPEFDELLQVSSVRETELFFDELLAKDLSVLNFIDSDFSMLNERLAKHYGVDGVTGQQFRRVPLPKELHRGGVLTHASVLKVTANGTNTSPVLRGVWVLENILGAPTPPPPANVPAVEPDIRGATTIRDQLAKHRQVAECASCHRRIDPPGFALESFDVIGGWRDYYRSIGEGPRVSKRVFGRDVGYRKGPTVDAGDELPDGRRFADIDEFKRLLLEDKDRIAACVAEKLVVYSTGGGADFADRAAIDAMVKRIAAKNYGLRTLVHEVVASEVFRTK
jgi:mono/diheme cytochrome c family protein